MLTNNRCRMKHFFNELLCVGVMAVMVITVVMMFLNRF